MSCARPRATLGEVIRVLTVDDHAVVRSGIVGLLQSEDGIVPVGAVAGCRDAIPLFHHVHPDVVIADFRLNDGDGLTLCRSLERDDWPSRVLVFSGFAGGELMLAATIAGAAGVLGKGTAGELLLAAVRAVAAGGIPSPAIPAPLLKSAGERLAPEDLPIFGMRLEGTSTREIADVLGIDRPAVEDRVDAIVDALKPRIEPPAMTAAREPSRHVGRWL
jgi:two-component system, NarL family, response regulator DevR